MVRLLSDGDIVKASYIKWHYCLDDELMEYVKYNAEKYAIVQVINAFFKGSSEDTGKKVDKETCHLCVKAYQQNPVAFPMQCEGCRNSVKGVKNG